MEIGTVRRVDIGEEMEQAYLDYAMSVIVSRALPDVRDGLKPVQRRILYAMHDMGLAHDKPYKKSARIVGEVLGKYHPHSDTAVYDAMVRMAQDFSMLCPLVDGQGNFGSIDGDGAAAMRYTEARLQAVTSELLNDIGKDTVDFIPNFDGTLMEPAVLPSALPNLLVNGASGIAVGMATNIPPHNLGEVCDALIYLTDARRNIENVTTEDLLQFIQGPDFPTGGVVYRYQDGSEDEPVDALEGAYAVGRGRFTMQAKAHVEEMTRNRHRIIVTELPYQVNKSRLVERIAELARDGRIEGITDLRDESDRQGLRIVIELSRTVDPREALAALYKLTPMQMTFGMILLALVDGEPRLLSLKRALQLFLEHRREIVTRRSRHDLEKAKLRAHILEGLLVALSNLDEVIALIRRSRDADTARRGLRKRFSLTEAQAQAILDMQLRRLATLERKKIEEEYKEKKEQIAYLEDLLAHPKKMMQVIRDELEELKRRYATPRRTQIVQREKRDLTARDLVADRDVVVVASASSKLRQYPLETVASLAKELDDEVAVAVVKAHTRDDLLVCMDNGDAYTLPLHRLPGGDRAGWASLSELCGVERTSGIAGLVCLSAGEDGVWPGFVTLVSRDGKVKRVACDDLRGLRGSGVVIGLDEGDTVMDAFRTTGGENILICTAQGQAIHFSEEEVRPMGLPAGGVLAIKLAEGDEIVGAMPAVPGAQIALATRAGYGKRTAVVEFPVQKRYGAGVIAYKTSSKTGPVAGAVLVGGKEKLAALTSKRRLLVVSAGNLPSMGRNAQGKASVRLRKGEEVDGLVALSPEPVLAGRTGGRARPEKLPAKSRKSRSQKAPTGVKAAKDDKGAAPRKKRTTASSKRAPAPSKKPGAAKETRQDTAARPKTQKQARKPASATPGKSLKKKTRPSSGAKTRKKGVVRSVKKPE